jgi:hypothetical protein
LVHPELALSHLLGYKRVRDQLLRNVIHARISLDTEKIDCQHAIGDWIPIVKPFGFIAIASQAEALYVCHIDEGAFHETIPDLR